MSEDQLFSRPSVIAADARIDVRIEGVCGRTVNIPSNQILARFWFDGAMDEVAGRLVAKFVVNASRRSCFPSSGSIMRSGA